MYVLQIQLSIENDILKVPRNIMYMYFIQTLACVVLKKSTLMTIASDN